MPGAIKVAYELQNEIVIAMLGAAFLYFVVIKSEAVKLEAIHDKLDEMHDRQKARPDRDIEMYDLTEDVGDQEQVELDNLRDQVHDIDRVVDSIEKYARINATALQQYGGRLLPVELTDKIRQVLREVAILKSERMRARVEKLPGIAEHLDEIEQTLSKYDVSMYISMPGAVSTTDMDEVIRVKQEPDELRQFPFFGEVVAECVEEVVRSISDTFRAAPQTIEETHSNEIMDMVTGSANDRRAVQETTDPANSAFNHGGEPPPTTGDHTNEINMTNNPSNNTAPVKVVGRKRGREDESDPYEGVGSGHYDSAPKRPRALDAPGAPNTPPEIPEQDDTVLPTAPVEDKAAIQQSFNSSGHPAPGKRPTDAAPNTLVKKTEFVLRGAIADEDFIELVKKAEREFMRAAHHAIPTVQQKLAASDMWIEIWNMTPYPQEHAMFQYANDDYGKRTRAHENERGTFDYIPKELWDEIRGMTTYKVWAKSVKRVGKKNASFQKKRTAAEMEAESGGGGKRRKGGKGKKGHNELR